ncbi:cell division protein SepF [Micrococcus sp. 2A]|uniref:cell division protein SepF n=1 Tax=Micrococcus sp. 2A TaxID=3142261 RepID=UPI002624D5BA|nr:cell division protein SepF [uncultured Micrococcus sp.]
MAGALKKTMIYLGLADGEEYEEHERTAAPREEASRRDVVEARRAPVSDEAPAVEEAPARVEPPAHAAGSTAAPVVSEPTEVRRAARPEPADQGYRAPVTPIKRAAASSAEGAPVRTLSTVHPRSYDDAKAIGEAFRTGMPVIMNVTELGENEAKRLVDFAAGLVFGLHGSIARITNKVFLLTPATVEVVGADTAESAEADAPYDAN